MKRVAGWFAAAWAVFGLLLLVERSLPPAAPVWLPHAVLKSALIVFSLGAIAVDRRRSLSDYGFRRPERVSWWRVVGGGALIGMAATTVIVLTPARGMKSLFEGWGFLTIVLSVWLYSSLAEEIFTRAWFQTRAAGDEPPGRVPAATVASGLLFGSMHLSLLLKNADEWTVVIIVTATSFLGLLAARLRAESGSVWPAFVTHVSFNVGGAAAAILLTIASLATGGAIPRP